MSQQTVDATDTEFAITRTFHAPLARVWDTWTDPAHFEKWFHAKPGSVQLDGRAGGAWKATLETPDGEMDMGGVYREVIDQEKLVWTLDVPGEPIVMTVIFSEHGGETDAVYGQNVVGPYTCDEVVASATMILEGFEQHIGGAA